MNVRLFILLNFLAVRLAGFEAFEFFSVFPLSTSFQAACASEKE